MVASLSLVLLSLVVSGCSSDDQEAWKRGGLPEGVTNHTDRITTLWQGAWIAALVAGVFVWGLILFAVIAYRRRATDTGLPPQVRYNVPIEVLYTVVPIVIVLVYFFFTARDQAEISEVSGKADHTVEVVGKRWSWDFNYLTDQGEADVFVTGTPGVPPELVLPRGESVEFVLRSRDVVHSFFVPAFQYKLDMFPGRTNRFEVTPTKTGTFAGKCAELCGSDHARMLFTTRIVEPEEYEAYLGELRRLGHRGRIPAGIGPENVDPTQAQTDSQFGDAGSDQ